MTFTPAIESRSAVPPVSAGAPVPGPVPDRLSALADLTKLGRQRQAGFDQDLLADADRLLRRSGERMRMSAAHTVVTLAGGTGSGKSSLFNALSGASFSPSGVMRPTTRHAHACVWGMEGAAPLLDWLGVQRRHRYARASALDEGESSLAGLLLLDLPDHDSVVSGSAAMVDRLVKLADMLIWVLDPLKYADAAVHQRYLMPLAGHAAVTTVVLNQCDTLPPDQISDCENDLRRLLDAEGLTETPIVATSATTGAGLNELRAVLAEAVASRQAASERIAADIDALLDRFAGYAGGPLPGVSGITWSASPPPAAPATEPDQEPDQSARPPWEIDGVENWNPWAHPEGMAAPAPAVAPSSRPPSSRPSSRPPWEDATPEPAQAGPDPAGFVPPVPAAALTAAFEKAAGVAAVTEALHGTRERTALWFVGWPFGKLLRRGTGVVRKPRSQAEPPRAQRSEIDNAITAFADAIAGDGTLPEPWTGTVRAAARSRAADVQAALGTAVAGVLPAQRKVAGWWRLVAILQWALLALVVAGIAWIGVILAYGEFHVARKSPSLLSDTSLLPWLAVMVVALLLLGSLVSSWCQNMVVLAADREREQAVSEIRLRIAVVTRDLVLTPAGAELADYERFRAALTAARR